MEGKILVLDIQQVSKFVMNNLMYITAGLGVLVIIMYGIIINLWMNLSYLKKRYRKMMTGVDGANLERLLIGHIDEVKQVVEENRRIDAENQRISALLQKALTRVGVVRFRAFDDMGSDLSSQLRQAHPGRTVFLYAHGGGAAGAPSGDGAECVIRVRHARGKITSKGKGLML